MRWGRDRIDWGGGTASIGNGAVRDICRVGGALGPDAVRLPRPTVADRRSENAGDAVRQIVIVQTPPDAGPDGFRCALPILLDLNRL
jgi:hypothetical protein